MHNGLIAAILSRTYSKARSLSISDGRVLHDLRRLRAFEMRVWVFWPARLHALPKKPATR